MNLINKKNHFNLLFFNMSILYSLFQRDIIDSLIINSSLSTICCLAEAINFVSPPPEYLRICIDNEDNPLKLLSNSRCIGILKWLIFKDGTTLYNLERCKVFSNVCSYGDLAFVNRYIINIKLMINRPLCIIILRGYVLII